MRFTKQELCLPAVMIIANKSPLTSANKEVTNHYFVDCEWLCIPGHPLKPRKKSFSWTVVAVSNSDEQM